MNRFFSLTIACCIMLASAVFLFSCEEDYSSTTSYTQSVTPSGNAESPSGNDSEGMGDVNDRPDSSPVSEAETQTDKYDNKNDKNVKPLF